MKVIFLDIDGVLCTGNHLWTTHSLRQLECKELNIPFTATDKRLTKTRDKFGNLFDPVAVMNLKKIIMSTGAKIVISSSWRLSGAEYMKELWKFRKLPGEVIDITPQWATKVPDITSRGLEIQEWLEEHPEVENYIIIDDDSDMLDEQYPFFIHTTTQFGLDYHLAKKAIHILNNN